MYTENRCLLHVPPQSHGSSPRPLAPWLAGPPRTAPHRALMQLTTFLAASRSCTPPPSSPPPRASPAPPPQAIPLQPTAAPHPRRPTMTPAPSTLAAAPPSPDHCCMPSPASLHVHLRIMPPATRTCTLTNTPWACLGSRSRCCRCTQRHPLRALSARTPSTTTTTTTITMGTISQGAANLSTTASQWMAPAGTPRPHPFSKRGCGNGRQTCEVLLLGLHCGWGSLQPGLRQWSPDL